MRKLIATLVLALALTALAATGAGAFPCGPSTCAPLSLGTPGSNLLLSRAQGLHGPLTAFAIPTGKAVETLDPGVLAADGRHYVSALPSGLKTQVVAHDLNSGRTVGTMQVGLLAGSIGAVSPTGRYAAVIAGEKNQRVAVVDLVRKTLVRQIRLNGYWQVDALSRDATRLYLLENLNDGGYRVRLHQAGRGLVPGAITDPKEEKPMQGFPWSSVGTPDGRYQATLFVKTGAGDHAEAFIHLLSLDRSRAACIDLAEGEFMSLARFAIVLSPDGRTLYAANPSLGIVQTVDLARGAVTKTVRFTPAPADTDTAAAFGAVSADGRSVFFSAGMRLQVLDTGALTVRTLEDIGPITGIGVSRSGSTLLAVRPNGDTVGLDARTGAPLKA